MVIYMKAYRQPYKDLNMKSILILILSFKISLLSTLKQGNIQQNYSVDCFIQIHATDTKIQNRGQQGILDSCLSKIRLCAVIQSICISFINLQQATSEMSAADFAEFMIGHYRVGKAIGEGTFGKVRLGLHIPTGQKVAVKTLQKEKIVEHADIERVTRQICILKVMHHPNIIQLYEIIESKTDIHLIMQYADGGQLFDYIVKKKRLDEKEAIFFMQQILAGVEYMHKNGVVHRDLKPQNLLLDNNKTLKIVDFGLSNQYKQGERLKTACGSPCYAAPQMIAGKKYECLNVDIWSCGIILYAMLCGYLPFEDPNTSKLYKKILSGDYEQPKVLTVDSKEILRNILNVDPNKRFKIQQIKSSRWYNSTGKNYLQDGLIVGRDLIDANQRLVHVMAKEGMNPIQIRNYIANNRHNQITSHYYLLKKKMEVFQSKVDKDLAYSRSDSPILYKPDFREELWQQNQQTRRDGSNNDSFNVTSMISSLVQINRNKQYAKNNGKIIKKDNYDRMEEFKLFPKKKTESIYDPQPKSATYANKKPGKVPLTSRSQFDEQFGKKINKSTLIESQDAKGLDRSNLATQTIQIVHYESRENKKQQEVSNYISLNFNSIDKEIVDPTERQNADSSPVTLNMLKKSDLLGYSNRAKKAKTQYQNPISTNGVVQTNKQLNNQETDKSKSHSVKISDLKQPPSIICPKTHAGPFNSKCLFYESPENLLLRVTDCLKNRMRISYHQIDAYILRISDSQQISIESLPGVVGYHILKFSSPNSLSEAIIKHLCK